MPECVTTKEQRYVLTGNRRNRKMPRKVLVVVGLMLLMLAGAASAQDVPAIKIKIDHPFVVMDATLPAGEYTINYELGANSFTITGSGPDALEAFTSVETRISGPTEHVDIAVPCVVFDVTGERYLLSEIWVPNQAGFLVSSEQKPHEHSISRAHR
jgi:hypothetical protein